MMSRKSFCCSCLLFLLLLSLQAVKLVKLRPIKTKGSVNVANNNQDIPAIYLGRDKLEVLDSSFSSQDENDGEDKKTNQVTICDVVPIPIQVLDQYNYIVKMFMRSKNKGQMSASSTSAVVIDKGSCIAAASILYNRDEGIYDKLPFEWGLRADARKQLYAFLSGGQGESSYVDSSKELTLNSIEYSTMKCPEAVFSYGLKKFLDCSIVGLILEVKDELGKNSVSLGAAVVLARTGFESEYRISTKQVGLPDDTDDRSDADACIISCHTDELVLLSMATNIPIYMPKPLFLGASVDASLEKGNDKDLIMRYKAKPAKNSNMRDKNDDALPAWEIFDPMEFVGMNSLTKRAVLRASGVTELPRPREGSQALEIKLLDLMDDAVRGEFLRIQASKGKSTSAFRGRAESSSSGDGNTDRQSLLQDMCTALEEGEIEKAEALRDRFAMLTMLKQDHTQEEGSYDKFLDQDEWYMEARRRAMAPRKRQE